MQQTLMCHLSTIQTLYRMAQINQVYLDKPSMMEIQCKIHYHDLVILNNINQHE